MQLRQFFPHDILLYLTVVMTGTTHNEHQYAHYLLFNKAMLLALVAAILLASVSEEGAEARVVVHTG